MTMEIHARPWNAGQADTEEQPHQSGSDAEAIEALRQELLQIEKEDPTFFSKEEPSFFSKAAAKEQSHQSGSDAEAIEALRQELLQIEKEDPTFFNKEEPSFFSKAGDVAGKVAKDIGGGLLEAPGQVVRGAQEAINETSNLGYSGVQAAAAWLGYDIRGENPVKFSDGWMPGKATTVTGNLVNDISQFAVGFVGAGKFMAMAKIAKAATTGGKIIQGAAKGAAADFTVFDPHEERVSDLIENYPSLSNPITEYLASDPLDSQAEGRFKNMLEGLGVGAAAEMLFLSVKGLRHARAGEADKATETAAQLDKAMADVRSAREAREAAEKAPEGETQLDLGMEGGGPGKDSPRANVEENPLASSPEMKRKVPIGTEDFKPVEKKIVVDDAKLRELVSIRVREQAYRGGEDVAGIRTDLIENGDDLKATMDALRVVYQDEMQKGIGNGGKPRTFEQVTQNVDRLADIIGDDPRLMLQRMRSTHQLAEHLDAEVRLYEDFLVTVGTKLGRLAELVDDPLGGLGGYKNRMELMDDFAKHYELMGNVQLMYKGIQTGTARTMNAMKMGGKERKELLMSGDASLDDLYKGGERHMVALAKRVKMAGSNPKALAKVTRGGFLNNLIGSTNEYWINSILSGPKTHAVNMASSAINTAFLPAERFIAGAIRGGTRQGQIEMAESALQYAGMIASLKDSIVLAAKSLKIGENVLDPGNAQYTRTPAISAAGWEVSNPIMAPITDFLGKVVRTPSRLLASEDEFFKQLNYRSEIRAKAYREDIANGLLKDPKEFSAFINKRLDESTDGAGVGLDQRALNHAREATFTNSLKMETRSGNPTWGESIQRLTAAHPTAQLVVPFVRTPTNILRFVAHRTPGINLMYHQYRKDMLGHNGPEARAKAASMMTTGGILWGVAINEAAEGNITGAPPKDPTVRAALERTGWRAYSRKTENADGTVTYTEYNRLDPYGMFLGIAADTAQSMAFADEQTKGEIAATLTVALMNNLNNKSYLSGLVQVVGAFSDPDRKFHSYAKNLTASFVPNVLNQGFKDDPYMREARTIIDGMLARTPGYSETVDPKRNIFGEIIHVAPTIGPDWISPISPAVQTQHMGGDQPLTKDWLERVNSDPGDELARQMYIHGTAIRPPPKNAGDLNLTQVSIPGHPHSAYDLYQELHGTVKIHGRTLKEALVHAIATHRYQNVLADGDLSMDGGRIKVLQAIFGDYRRKAEHELRKMSPEIDAAFIMAARKKALAITQKGQLKLEAEAAQ